MCRALSRVLCISMLLLVAGTSVRAASSGDNDGDSGSDTDVLGRHFVHRSGRLLSHAGSPFRIAGASNYYLMYSSPFMVDSVLNSAATSSFSVVRLWGSLEIGNQDGTGSVDGIKNGVYFQYLTGQAPAFNDGPSGLEHLDYVIYKAGLLGLKVIIPFVNNWNAFGGMDQYVRWRGGQFHDDFYTDPTIRGWYHAWIEHLLNRTNVYTGVKYKDDATIMAWELANEPRCRAFGVYPESPTCNTQTLISWADEVSRFIKRIDHRHMLSAGDEGFYCIAGATDFTENCGEGVDTLALADLPAMDAMSFHLYPDNWGKPASFGVDWIKRHIRDGRRIHERVLLGEFAIMDKSIRNPIYQQWTDAVREEGGGGALFWMLADKQDDGTLYPDYDHFTLYCPSPVCTTFTNFARLMRFLPPFDFSPVADDDRAATPENTPVTLSPLPDDITYGGATLVPDSIDLDPATTGQQTQFATDFGTYALQPGGSVLFTPATGFSGTASTPYVVSDTRGRVSHPASLVVTVQGPALYSFEDGTDGWGPASFNAGAGAVEQSTLFATEGPHSLRVDATTAGGWFGPALTPPLPLSLANVGHVLIDITAATAGTSQSVALQVGSDFHWCQTDFGFINAGTSTTVDVNLATLLSSVTSCLGSLPGDTSSVQRIWVFFNGGGTSYLDNVRVTPKAPAGAAIYGFEDGADSWAAASFNAGAGTTVQSTSFATEGTHSLRIDASAAGGWFGPAPVPPLPLALAGVGHMLFDITTTTAGTSQSVALQVGSDFHWCQTDFGFINANTSTTVDVNLATLFASTTGCLGSLPADTSSAQAIWVFFNGGGTSYLDNVRTTP